MGGRHARREAVLRSLRADATRVGTGGERLDWAAIAHEASRPRPTLAAVVVDPDPAGSVRAAVDAARTAAGSGPLPRSAALDRCANQLASAIVVDPDERLLDVCAATGYRASSILRLTSTQPVELGPAAAQRSVDEWLADAEASATLLIRTVTDMGVAANVGGDGRMTFTVLLARR